MLGSQFKENSIILFFTTHFSLVKCLSSPEKHLGKLEVLKRLTGTIIAIATCKITKNLSTLKDAIN